MSLLRRIAGAIGRRRDERLERHDALDSSEDRDALTLSSPPDLGGRDGKDDAELKALQSASDREPENADAHCKLGYAHSRRGLLDDAADCFTLALHFKPGMIEACLGLGGVFMQARRPQDALACYRKGLEQHPGSAALRSSLGLALFEVEELDAAIAECEQATRLASGLGEAWHNLGFVLLHADRAREALVCFDRALAQGLDVPSTRACRGHALRQLRRLDEATGAYDDLLARHPGFEDAIINRGFVHLLAGRYREGWRDYAWRFGPPGPVPRGFPFRPWRGESLHGRSVLVYAEQGIGDEIMFASCLPDVMRAASRCVIECNVRLAGFYRRAFPAAVVHGGRKTDSIDWVRDIGTVDFQSPIGDLPRYLRPSRESFPGRAAYLTADAEAIARWRARFYSLGPGPYLGFCWRGGSVKTHARARSIALSALAPALECHPGRLVCLQRGALDAEEMLILQRLNAFVPEEFALEDIEDLAALVTALDNLVCIDSTVAHVAGALGCSARVLLQFCPEWRFGYEGDAMPWYPSVILMRQPAPSAWGPVVEALAVELRRPAGKLANPEP